MANVVLSVLAHPDDAEFLCAGTLIRLMREHGWSVHIASMTPGDCGSAELPPEEIANVRRGEGTAAAAVIGAAYHCLEERDLLIVYGERPLERVVRLMRQARPALVLTHSPADYMLDHEQTATIVRAACFAAAVPNFLCDRIAEPPLEHIPHLYYCDAVEGKDLLGRAVEPGFCIDISTVIETKAEMLARHASQRDWLRKQHGMDQYIVAMRQWGEQRGKARGVACAEGFRQHLGHSYPQSNLLGELLGTVSSRLRLSAVSAKPQAVSLLRPRNWLPHPLQQFLHVLPHIFFRRRIAQQVGRMIRHHDWDAAIIVEPAAQPSDRQLHIEKVLCSTRPQAADEFRPYQVECLLQVFAAVGGFIGKRRPIAGRPAAQDITDKHIFTLHAAGRDDAIEQLSRRTDKRLALTILVGPRRFADEAQFCIERPDAEDRLSPRGGQR